jgi:hypothetical protein
MRKLGLKPKKNLPERMIEEDNLYLRGEKDE